MCYKQKNNNKFESRKERTNPTNIFHLD